MHRELTRGITTQKGTKESKRKIITTTKNKVRPLDPQEGRLSGNKEEYRINPRSPGITMGDGGKWFHMGGWVDPQGGRPNISVATVPPVFISG